MAIYKDRVAVRTNTTGTGAVTLGTALSGHRTFGDSGIENGDYVSYLILDSNGNWETGRGTYSSSGPSLSRDLLAASSTDEAINLTGNAIVGIGPIALDFEQVIAKDVEDQLITGGVQPVSKDLGTGSGGNTITVRVSSRQQQHYINNGSHSIVPTEHYGSCFVDVTNGASAAVPNISAFDHYEGAFTITNGHKFRCVCSNGPAGSLIIIQPMQ